MAEKVFTAQELGLHVPAIQDANIRIFDNMHHGDDWQIYMALDTPYVYASVNSNKFAETIQQSFEGFWAEVLEEIPEGDLQKQADAMTLTLKPEQDKDGEWLLLFKCNKLEVMQQITATYKDKCSELEEKLYQDIDGYLEDRVVDDIHIMAQAAPWTAMYRDVVTAQKQDSWRAMQRDTIINAAAAKYGYRPWLAHRPWKGATEAAAFMRWAVMEGKEWNKFVFDELGFTPDPYEEMEEPACEYSPEAWHYICKDEMLTIPDKCRQHIDGKVSGQMELFNENENKNQNFNETMGTMNLNGFAAMMGITKFDCTTGAVTKQVELSDLAPEGMKAEQYLSGVINEVAARYGKQLEAMSLSDALEIWGDIVGSIEGLNKMSHDEQCVAADRRLHEVCEQMVKEALGVTDTAPEPVVQTAVVPAPQTAPAEPAKVETPAAPKPFQAKEVKYVPTDNEVGAKYAKCFQLTLEHVGPNGHLWATDGKKVTLVVTDGEESLTIVHNIEKRDKRITLVSEEKTYKFRGEAALWAAIDEQDLEKKLALLEKAEVKTAAPKTAAPKAEPKTEAKAAEPVAETPKVETPAVAPTSALSISQDDSMEEIEIVGTTFVDDDGDYHHIGEDVYLYFAKDSNFAQVIDRGDMSAYLENAQADAHCHELDDIPEWMFDDLEKHGCINAKTAAPAALQISTPTPDTAAQDAAAAEAAWHETQQEVTDEAATIEPQTAGPVYTQADLDAAVADAVAKTKAQIEAQIAERIDRAVKNAIKDILGTVRAAI